ncbi:MAG: NlpC/P60 family protein [Actinomycetales bacterium]
MGSHARHRAPRRPRLASPFTRDRGAARGVSPALTGSVLVLATTLVATAASAEPIPSQEQVDAAREAASTAASQVSSLEGQLQDASDNLERTQVAAAMAVEDYNEAQVKLEQASAAADAATTAAAAADQDRAAAQDQLGALAARTYRHGGAIGPGLEAMLTPGGPQDLIDRADALDLLTTRNQAVFAAADQAANTAAATRAQAAAAEADRAEAAAAADEARRRAIAEQARAQQVLSDTQTRRDSLIAQLAVLNSTSADLERRRQDGLEAQRQAAAEEAARRAVAAREAAAARAAADQAAADQAAAQQAAAAKAEAARVAAERNAALEQAKAEQTAAEAAAAEAAAAQQAADRAAGRAQDGPKDLTGTDEVARIQAEVAAAQAAAEKAAADKAAADRAAAEAAAKAAADQKSGSSKGSASAGQAAVDWARTQIGKPYQWGATGPNSYDCSGLTGAAWRRAGVSLPRVSRDQYRAATKISYSDLRPGDLVFYGDGTNASSIHHVAMYSGNGRMIEAPRTGLNVREVPLRMRGAMKYAGRP